MKRLRDLTLDLFGADPAVPPPAPASPPPASRARTRGKHTEKTDGAIAAGVAVSNDASATAAANSAPAPAAAPLPVPVARREKDAGPLSVTEFTRRLKNVLEGSFPVVSVRGEISNLRRQASGHVYFTLKDAGSQLAAVLFRGDALRTRCNLRDGIQVVATGAVGVYEPRGGYQLVVRVIEEDGAGRLQRDFERLKQKLAAEGLFDRALKRPVPPLPRAIGIVTSPTGAALQDFLRILRRRDWRGRVVILPVRVQGAEAAGEIAVAIARAGGLRDAAGAPLLDLLVVARGGGSLEDLQPFNEEVLARAVRASGIPVISAVGHEIDFTLCDFAADVRAETPSGAAELITSSHLACRERLDRAQAWLTAAAERQMEARLRGLELLRSRLERHAPARRVEAAWLRLDDLRNRLRATPRLAAHLWKRRLAEVRSRLEAHAPENRVRLAAQRLGSLKTRMDKGTAWKLERTADHLGALGQRLRASGVDATLQRGFAIVSAEGTGRLVTTVAAAPAGARLRLRFADGETGAVAE